MKKNNLNWCKLSTSDVSYLVNHSVYLETLCVGNSNLCDDGLIITKETDKLEYLKWLNIFDNPNITDECIINLVKGCHNLKVVNIEYCPKLTDTSLFSIAANCPNFEKIFQS